MTIQEQQDSIVQEFSQWSDWEKKYEHLIEMGKTCFIDSKYKTDQYKVKGCQSSVWMFAEYKEGKIFYYADSDAAIVRGLVALVLKVYSGRTPEEIMQTPPQFLEKLGLNTHLSQTRTSGLASMIKQVKLFAYALSIQSQKSLS